MSKKSSKNGQKGAKKGKKGKKEQKWSRGKKLPGYGWQKYNMCIIYVRMYQLIDTHRQIINI